MVREIADTPLSKPPPPQKKQIATVLQREMCAVKTYSFRILAATDSERDQVAVFFHNVSINNYSDYSLSSKSVGLTKSPGRLAHPSPPHTPLTSQFDPQLK